MISSMECWMADMAEVIGRGAPITRIGDLSRSAFTEL